MKRITLLLLVLTAGGPTSAADQRSAGISLPVAITVFPDEVYRSPETWARRAYRNLIYFHEVDRGGHFAPGSSRKFSLKNSVQRFDRCGPIKPTR